MFVTLRCADPNCHPRFHWRPVGQRKYKDIDSVFDAKNSKSVLTGISVMVTEGSGPPRHPPQFQHPIVNNDCLYSAAVEADVQSVSSTPLWFTGFYLKKCSIVREAQSFGFNCTVWGNCAAIQPSLFHSRCAVWKQSAHARALVCLAGIFSWPCVYRGRKAWGTVDMTTSTSTFLID